MFVQTAIFKYYIVGTLWTAYFLTVPEAGERKAKVLADSVSGDSSICDL